MTDEHDKSFPLPELCELKLSELATPSRRNFLKSIGVTSLAAATSPIWLESITPCRSRRDRRANAGRWRATHAAQGQWQRSYTEPASQRSVCWTYCVTA